MSKTRNLVLQTLLDRQQCTINDLAEAVSINPISVRHHIGRLEEEGIVSSKEERHGVGRPRRVYYMTEKGVELFPARTVRFTNRFIDQIKDSLSKETLDLIFSDMAANLAKGYRNEVDLKTLNLPKRLDLIREWLGNEGFNVQIEQTSSEIQIRESGCPYFHVGREHNEICNLDQAIISEILDTTPERTTCLLDGDSHCTYVIPMEAIQEASISL